jgi:FkbH-like protein
MKLIEALKIVQKSSGNGQPLHVSLVCSFNPLHLKTFLAAEMSQLTSRSVDVEVGLYGDIDGNIERALKSDAEVGFLLLEWADLDPRLGIRNLGGWQPQAFADILESVTVRVQRLETQIAEFAAAKHLVVSGPTLPLPPVAYTPGWQASLFELELNALLSQLLSSAARHRKVRVLNRQRLDMTAPLAERADIEAEVQTGFPYSLTFASSFAGELAKLAVMRSPMKGLITDLDDTLWRGILGEVGVQGVSWDLDHHTQMHGVYQQFLHSLSAAGVLIGVASKNDPKLVEQAMRIRELLIPGDAIFPIVANWGPKSESVGRILKTWNIAADAVVFVDDSALELAEVKAAHPSIQCIQFPSTKDAGIYEMMVRLRDMFGKQAISDEDALRLQSIRARSELGVTEQQRGTTSEDFLRDANAEISIGYAKEPLDPRALELINKTNQFNLNGKRCAEAEWVKYLAEPSAFLMIVSYKDKFGPLGKIAILAGKQDASKLKIDYWVMSCRAFSRRIEFHCMEQLFDRFAVDSVALDVLVTERNGPVREFLQSLGIAQDARHISRAEFERVRTPAIHRVVELDETREAVERV